MAVSRRGFTLIEMLTTVTALVILLGLMVSLARYVRSRSSEELTRTLLGRLEKAVRGGGADPAVLSRLAAELDKVPPLVRTEEAEPGRNPGEGEMWGRSHVNCEAYVKACQSVLGPRSLDSLPLSLFDGRYVRDAWGTPVVYMAPLAPNVGLRPQNRAFFVSAGPDRKFSTVFDNLYSYEQPWDERWNR
jgi:prepilin-type N-terminal cleavage/methylation domain-containing protein